MCAAGISNTWPGSSGHTSVSLERGQFNRMMDRFPELQRQLSEIAVERLRD
jgi:hypothetical protein